MTTSAEMRHAGVHWSENAGGEHPNRETIARLPGMAGSWLICSPSGRFHYTYLRSVNPDAFGVWRAIPRKGKEPARLGWDPQRVATECLNIWDEPTVRHGGREWFCPLNELQFSLENGGPFPGYGEMAINLDALRTELVDQFARRGQDVGLVFPAWVPQDEMDHLEDWAWAARKWACIGLHCYGSASTQRARYQSYRAAFPGQWIHVGEHNANREGHDEREILEMWAEVAHSDPRFAGATYYIWETDNANEGMLSIWGNPEREALFADPPTIAEPSEPQEPDMPTLDPWEHWSAEEIARVTKCPLDAVAEHWPRLVEQLGHCGLTDKPVQQAMIGTIAIETASTAAPVREAFWLDEAWRRANLLRYYPYYGRGFIQLTWRENYAAYGPKVAGLWGTSPDQPDFDLVGDPDRALDPDIASAVAALYFRDHADGGIPVSARAGHWREVRRLVQGGDAGLDRLTEIVVALGADVPVVLTERMYGADVPDGVIRQQNSWTCAVRSAFAALWAMAEQGHGPAVTYGDEGPSDVYEWLVPAVDGPGIGLLDHTGAGLAQALRSHGYAASHAYPVTLDQVLERAGAQPLLLGGDAWNHWVMVRGRTNDGGLVLENPMPGHAGIDDYLRDSFGRLGPFSMVWIDLVPVKPARTPEEQIAGLVGAVAYLADDVAPMEPGAARIAEARRVREEFVGPKPAA